MTAEEILNDKFYKPDAKDWYKPVLQCMELYAEAKAKEFAEWLHENWNAKHGGWSAKTGDINTIYSAKVLYETFNQSK